MPKVISRLIVPPFPGPGDAVGVATPAGPYSAQRFRQGLSILKRWGFRPVPGRKRIKAQGYLAGTDEERARELNDLFGDPEIKAVFCSRGGYGSLRILESLDYDRIRRNPKLFMGFSDVTALLTALNRRVGLMTLHGPMITTLPAMPPPVLQQVRKVLSGGYALEVPLNKKKALNPGSAQGRLLGGNLTLLSHLIGTPFEPEWKEAVLFLEDCGEAPYRLDRLFRHLRLCGVFDKVSALLLGTFLLPGGKILSDAALGDLLEGLDIPVWMGLPVGHGRRNIPLPIGAPASLDGEKGILRIDL